MCWSVAYTVSVYGESRLFFGAGLCAHAPLAPRKMVTATAVSRRRIEDTSIG
jgi:hypothetical protein